MREASARNKRIARDALYPERILCSFSQIQMEHIIRAARTPSKPRHMSEIIRDCVDRRFGLTGSESNARFNPDAKP